MSRAHHEVHIARSPEEVFDFLADGTNNPQWQSFVTATGPTVRDVRVGTKFQQRSRHPLGFTVSSDYEVTVYQRPRYLALVVKSGGPIRPSVIYELMPAEGGTDLRCTVEYSATGLTRLARPLLTLLHPLFAWEASSVERLEKAMGAPPQPVS